MSHEGSKEVRRNKLTLLSIKHEMFTMDENDTIKSMIARLQTILNSLRSLGTVISQYDINDKVLITLPFKWREQEASFKEPKDM